jgi:hypothetical protein
MNPIFKAFLFVALVTVAYGNVVGLKKSQPIHPFLSAIGLPRNNNAVRKVSDQSCDENQLAVCAQTYATALGLPYMPADPTQFEYYMIGIVLNQGLAGFEMECKATNEFIACLGETYATCLSVENLESIGFDPDDATVYATLAVQLQYECGPAYEIFVEHFDCALADLKTKTYQIVYCVESFNKSMYNDPTKACESLQTFVQCYEGIFENCGADFAGALCESMKVAFAVTLPQCTVDCSQSKEMKMKQKLDLVKKFMKN